MQTLTKKTTILFSPELYRQLERLADLYKTSVAHLVRQAVINQYLLSDRKKRIAAVKAMARMNLPLSHLEQPAKKMNMGALEL